MNGMFERCSNLQSVQGLDSWDTSNVSDFGRMFQGCSSLTSLSLGFSTSAAQNMSSMFENCLSLSRVTGTGGWDLHNVVTFTSMFKNCPSLRSLSLNSSTPAAQDMSSMFEDCQSLTSLDLRSFTTSSVYSFENMFRHCSLLSSIEGVEDFDTSGAESMQWMFAACRALTKLDLHNYTCNENTYSLNGMFRGCTSLVDLDISGMDTRRVSNMGNLFSAPDPSDTTDSNTDLNGVDPTPLHRLVLGPHWSFAGDASSDSLKTTFLVTPATGEQVGLDGVTHRYLGTWGMDASTSPTQLTTPSLLAAYQESANPVDPSNPTLNSYSEPHAWLWGEEQAYTLAYDANGGENAPSSQVIYVDPTSSAPLGSWTVDESQPTRDGFTFSGWNTQADGSGASYGADDEIPLNTSVTSMTLYAQWNAVLNPVVPSNPGGNGGTLAGGAASSQQGGEGGASANGASSSDGVASSDNTAQTGDPVNVGMIVALLVIVGAAAPIVATRAHRHATVQGHHCR